MVSELDRRVVQRFKGLMVARGVPLHATILFGSRARGDDDPDADYDVLVIVDHLDRTIRRTVSDCAWEAGFDDALVIVPVVMTKDDFFENPTRSSLLVEAVRAEGVHL